VIVARAPGKVVALGEYAVLDGAPAVVLALDRFVEVTMAASSDGACRLVTRAGETIERSFVPGQPSGVPLIDFVGASVPLPTPWHATIDSRALFAGSTKLGLGSSAAVVCAWAGAFAAFAREQGLGDVADLRVGGLIELHSALQGGKGSGLDVAASYTGGAITFRLTGSLPPQIGSVRLPNSVGFAGIFTGRSASTPELVSRYRAWLRERPKEAAELVGRLRSQAEAGCAALTGDDAAGWLEAFEAYGLLLQELGASIGADIVTAEHREIGAEARRHGVAYKISGAGGGDLGLACAADAGALRAFSQSVGDRGFRVIKVSLADHGLQVARRGTGWQR
jgi:phosphomevalonate kinase